MSDTDIAFIADRSVEDTEIGKVIGRLSERRQPVSLKRNVKRCSKQNSVKNARCIIKEGHVHDPPLPRATAPFGQI